MHPVLISTRKGLFVAEPTGTGGAVALSRGHFIGDNVTLTMVDPRGGWYAALDHVPAIKDEKRIAVDGKIVVTRTSDGGKSFDVLSKGLPDTFAFDLVYRHALALAPDGALAFGSTTGNVFVSRDRGNSWSVISHHVPPVYAVTFA